ncbi:hypothetical protein M514_04045 [Trichuris suis]|uniref:Uncharacterized protein n=1 Tax=Trichuris suis TaxID=68888 RepID=A0A085NSS5_9BILA|nr:hypothetical protein M513_04045 [Trichuris suis]KFD72521.1 hypothetical protein M514_04045 [Trichuris suis]
MGASHEKAENSATDYDHLQTCSLKRTLSEEFLMDCSELELTPEPPLGQWSSTAASGYYPTPGEPTAAESTAPNSSVKVTDGEPSNKQLDNDHQDFQYEKLWDLLMGEIISVTRRKKL